jgi:hypothetical protein
VTSPYSTPTEKGLALKLERPAEAEPSYQRALTMAKQVFGAEHPASGEIMLRYSAVLPDLQRNSEAKSMAREARAIIGGSQGKADTQALALGSTNDMAGNGLQELRLVDRLSKMLVTTSLQTTPDSLCRGVRR